MAKYRTREVLAATGAQPQQLASWLDRHKVSLSPDDTPAAGKGTARAFGLRSVHRIALAHAMTRLGIQAGTALDLASLYTEAGTANRAPNQLFEGGRTLIVATNEGGRIINLPADGNVLDHVDGAAIVVDVAKLIFTTNRKLGLQSDFKNEFSHQI